MKHTYKVSGMTCSSCVSTVQELLSKVSGVQQVSIDLTKGEATVDMEQHIATAELASALREHPKYQLSELQPQKSVITTIPEEEKKSWFETYQPIILVFSYIIGVTLLIEWIEGKWDWMRWMNHFMGGFFLTFSFFKLLNIRGFAESYSMYDVIAKKWNAWGYVYACVELLLGVAFLTRFSPMFTNIATLLIMLVSIVGVIQSVMNKRKIKCACLGAVFNLPMSTVTITEDALMIGMSGLMLSYLV